MHRLRRLSLELEERECPVDQPTVELTDRRGVNGETTVMMFMVKVYTEVRRPQVVDVVMLGKATTQLTDLFMVPRVALLKGHQALTTGSMLATVVIVAMVSEVASTGNVSLLHLLSLGRRPLM